MKRFLQIANVLALVVTVIINYLSNTGIFNDNTMSSVSARYQNYFTPAGYAFSIWGLIYLSLLGFVIYQGREGYKKRRNETVVLQIGWRFVISCLLNCCWVLAWLYGYIGLSVLLMIGLLITLLQIVVLTTRFGGDVPVNRFLFVNLPFSIYAGWIAVALIANMAAWLTSISWDGFGISDVSWAIIMICVAGAVNIFMCWTRNLYAFVLVGVWALAAIAVANHDEQQQVVITAMVVAAILVLTIVFHFAWTRKKALKSNT